MVTGNGRGEKYLTRVAFSDARGREVWQGG